MAPKSDLPTFVELTTTACVLAGTAVAKADFFVGNKSGVKFCMYSRSLIPSTYQRLPLKPAWAQNRSILLLLVKLSVSE